MAKTQRNPEQTSPKLDGNVGGEFDSSTVGCGSDFLLQGAGNESGNNGSDAVSLPVPRSDEASDAPAEVEPHADGAGDQVSPRPHVIFITGGSFVNCQFHAEKVHIEGGTFYHIVNDSG
ncbi:hypothetical protein GALMADRAFT_141565 [Galerina marginata CBS 339.88]|uniref:Uncharacterized protein n=1 Tax=Galerina marginata (strain CBS 339.88) TaxID=685588 RepID=A0A067T6B5_GALM3|nr:hypothetical protein GALMADRAFT_141565 [Galerina marginata CBS 339.88]